MERIKTVQIPVPESVYNRLIDKKANRPWLTFILEDILGDE